MKGSYTLVVNDEIVGTFDTEMDLMRKYADMGLQTVARVVYPDGRRERVYSGLDRDWNWAVWTRRSLKRGEVVRVPA